MCVCLHIHATKGMKNDHQADDKELENQLESLKKHLVTLGHHLAGSLSAKKRFEAMCA